MCVCVPALVEGVDLDPVVCVFLQDLLGVLVRVERVHENQRDIRVVRLIQVLWGETAKHEYQNSVRIINIISDDMVKHMKYPTSRLRSGHHRILQRSSS